MKNNIFSNSLAELKNIRSLTFISMLMAVYVVLDFTRLVISPELEISFAFLAIAITGMLFGPVAAGIMAGLGDTICFFLRPNGPFFPGFTLNAILYGVIFGIFLYKKRPALKNIIISKAILTILISIILNPIWLKIMYGSKLFALLRITKAFILFPVECIIMLIGLNTVHKIFLSSRSV